MMRVNDFPALGVQGRLLVLNGGPFGMARHVNLAGRPGLSGREMTNVYEFNRIEDSRIGNQKKARRTRAAAEHVPAARPAAYYRDPAADLTQLDDQA